MTMNLGILSFQLFIKKYIAYLEVWSWNSEENSDVKGGTESFKSTDTGFNFPV